MNKPKFIAAITVMCTAGNKLNGMVNRTFTRKDDSASNKNLASFVRNDFSPVRNENQ